MACYEITFKESAKKEIRSLPKKEIIRVVTKAENLSKHPRPKDCTKLAKDKFRIRQGDYRIIYNVNDREKKVTVFKVRHRREAYR